jgi:hypothetical protein
MDKLATMDTIGSSFRPWLSCQGICLLNRPQTGDTDSVQPIILLPVQRDSQETFIPCEARMLWYSADRTSSQQLRDTTHFLEMRDDGRDVVYAFVGCCDRLAHPTSLTQFSFLCENSREM